MKKQSEILTREHFDRRINNLKSLVFGAILWLIFSITSFFIKPSFLNSLTMIILFVVGIYLVVKSMLFEKGGRR